MPSTPPSPPWRIDWTLSRGDTGQDVSVRLSEDLVRHFYNRHLHNPANPDERPRWAVFLEEATTGLLTRLDSCWSEPQAVRDIVLGELASRLEVELRQALAMPRFVEYEETDLGGKHLHDTLEMPSLCALIFVLRVGKRRLALQTAFFPYGPVGCSVKQLRKEAIRDLRQEYARDLNYAGHSYLTLPDPTHQVPVYEQGVQVGWRTNIQFVSPEKWGFQHRILPGPPAPPEWVWP